VKALFRLAAAMAETELLSSHDAAGRAIAAGLIGRRDLCAREASRRITLGARITALRAESLRPTGPLPAALEHLLQYAPEDEIIFRRPDGAGVTASEMLRLLREDDAVALHFLQDIHGAAVRMVKVQAKKRQAG
jgi:hypothetical protein